MGQDNEDEDRRQSAIDQINDLWPPDSEHQATRDIGKKHILEALAAEWRSLPTAVLEHMARTQLQRDHYGAGVSP